jgi:hypothetical protein
MRDKLYEIIPTLTPTILTEGASSVPTQQMAILQWFLTSFVNAMLSLFGVKIVQCTVGKAFSDTNPFS